MKILGSPPSISGCSSVDPLLVRTSLSYPGIIASKRYLLTAYTFLPLHPLRFAIAARLRLAEGLERRSILPLDEYLTRHIEARAEMFDKDICGLSEHLVQRRSKMNFEVMVRHIGLGTTPEMVEKRAAGRLRRSVKKGR